ncbi:MAG: hypothetical protein M1839_001721 [Geoglossum umbratile]|nr:MAG: hypothetical protein M1839_001721 [Geoglossum umbratile]
MSTEFPALAFPVMSAAPPYFLPATIGSVPFDSAARIRDLKELLLDKKYESQKENILLAIHMYETGELPSQTKSRVWFVNGKVADFPAEITKGMAVWEESISAYAGSADAIAVMGSCRLTVIIGFSVPNGSFSIIPARAIFARFRLMAAYGGDPSVTIPVIIANDTGSNIQTIFMTDLAYLGYDPNVYQCPLNPAVITTANGVVVRRQIYVEAQVCRIDGTAASPWFVELAVVTPDTPGVEQTRLSGERIRNFFYFATAPGNEMLYIALKKNGVMSQLPAV